MSAILTLGIVQVVESSTEPAARASWLPNRADARSLVARATDCVKPKVRRHRLSAQGRQGQCGSAAPPPTYASPHRSAHQSRRRDWNASARPGWRNCLDLHESSNICPRRIRTTPAGPVSLYVWHTDLAGGAAAVAPLHRARWQAPRCTFCFLVHRHLHTVWSIARTHGIQHLLIGVGRGMCSRRAQPELSTYFGGPKAK